jgi:hypothetical protein
MFKVLKMAISFKEQSNFCFPLSEAFCFLTHVCVLKEKWRLWPIEGDCCELLLDISQDKINGQPCFSGVDNEAQKERLSCPEFYFDSWPQEAVWQLLLSNDDDVYM